MAWFELVRSNRALVWAAGLRHNRALLSGLCEVTSVVFVTGRPTDNYVGGVGVVMRCIVARRCGRRAAEGVEGGTWRVFARGRAKFIARTGAHRI